MTSPSKFYHVIQIILKMCSCDQSLETVAFLRQNLSQPQFYKDFTRKIAFFEGWSWFKFINLGLALGINLKLLRQCGKSIKSKSQKVFGANSYVCWSYRERVVGGVFLPRPLPPIPNRFKTGFIKTTEHRPTDPPTTDPTIYVKIQDQILNIFCIL